MPWSWSEPPFHPPAQKDKNSPTCGPSIPAQKAGQLHSNMFCPVDPAKEPKVRRTLLLLLLLLLLLACACSNSEI